MTDEFLCLTLIYLISFRCAPWQVYAYGGEPDKLQVNALNATLTITYRGEKLQGQYWLTINETEFSELPRFEEEIEVPEIAHSTIVEHFGNNVQRIDFNLFLKGLLQPISVEHNMRSGMVC